MDDGPVQVPVIAVTAAVGAVILLIALLYNLRKGTGDSKGSKASQNGVSHKKKGQVQQKSKISSRPVKPKFVPYSHPWLAGTLKGHSKHVLDLDFSTNNKYLISCADDRAVFLWSVKDFALKDHKSIRANIDLDHATKVRFSPDSRAYIVNLYNENTIRVYKIGKKDDGGVGNITAALDFKREYNETEILNIGISNNGKFIMTAYKDTMIIIWDLKGEVLAKIDTHQMSNSCCMVSPCGRFVGSSGFTPDVKVWHVVFDKSGSFKEVTRGFELKGHHAGIYSFDFSNDSTRMVSVSKDGTWKYWDTNVEFQLGQDPYLLYTGKYDIPGFSMITLAPDGRSAAITNGKTIRLYNTISGDLAETFTNVHSEEITALRFDQGSRYLASTGDKHICVFHNVPGYKAKVLDLTKQKDKAKTQSQSDRIIPQLNDAKKALDAVLEIIAEKSP